MRRIESRFYRTVSESRRERGMSSRVIECPFCGCRAGYRVQALADGDVTSPGVSVAVIPCAEKTSKGNTEENEGKERK